MLLLLCELGYLAAANILLNSGLVPKLLNKNVQDIELHYRWGFSLLPGILHFKEMGLHVQDHNMQLYFSLSQLRVTVNPIALLKKEFHAVSAAGSDLSFRFRLKRAPKEITETLKASVPSIPGRDTFVKEKRKASSGGETWKLRISSIAIDRIREMWFESYRYQGLGSLSGGFYLWTGGKELEIFDTGIHLESGKLEVAGRPLAESISTVLRARIDFIEPEKMTPENEHRKITEAISAGIEGRLQIANLDFLNHYLPRERWLSFERGHGPVELALVVENGLLAPQSRLTVMANDISVRLWNQEMTGNGSIRLVPAGPASMLALKLDDFFVLPRRKGVHGSIVGSGLELEAIAERFDIARLGETQPMRLELRIPKSRITDLRFCNAFFPAGSQVRFQRGEATIEAKMTSHTSGRADRGFVHVEAIGALAQVARRQVKSDVIISAIFDESQVTRGYLKIRDTFVKIRRLAVADLSGKLTPSDWWADFTVARAELGLRDETTLAGRLEVQAKDATPLLDIVMPAPAERSSSIATTLLKFNKLRASVDATLGEDSFGIANLYVTSDRGYAKGWLRTVDSSRLGRFLLVVEPFAVGLEVKGDETNIRLQDAFKWYQSSLLPKSVPAE